MLAVISIEYIAPAYHDGSSVADIEPYSAACACAELIDGKDLGGQASDVDVSEDVEHSEDFLIVFQ